MANESENKLLFRMHHIIPRGLASSFDIPDSGITLPPSPQDIEIQMTWGKVAGKPIAQLRLKMVFHNFTSLKYYSQSLGPRKWPAIDCHSRLARQLRDV